MRNVEKEKSGKKSYINYLYIIFIVGIIILLFGNTVLERGQSAPEQSEEPHFEEAADEERLEAVLSQIKGVGSAKVMITYENSGTSNYLSDVTYENQNETKRNTKKVVMTSGSPVVYEKTLPKVMGVIVVCDGAGDSYVKSNVVKAVCAVTGVYEHKVGVFERK